MHILKWFAEIFSWWCFVPYEITKNEHIFLSDVLEVSVCCVHPPDVYAVREQFLSSRPKRVPDFFSFTASHKNYSCKSPKTADSICKSAFAFFFLHKHK